MLNKAKELEITVHKYSFMDNDSMFGNNKRDSKEFWSHTSSYWFMETDFTNCSCLVVLFKLYFLFF